MDFADLCQHIAVEEVFLSYRPLEQTIKKDYQKKLLTMTTPLQLFEHAPSFTVRNPHYGSVRALVELNDGSFVSCSDDNTAKRWLRTATTNNNFQLLGTYRGHLSFVWCVMEKDDNTIVTGSLDNTVKVWSKTTCECLDTLQMRSVIRCLLKTKDNTRFVFGLGYGTVEMRRVNDLGVLFSFSIHRLGGEVTSVCELEDGSFVSSAWKTMERWDETGTVLQTFSGHSSIIIRVIELNRDIIVSASQDTTVKMWKVSTGECLRTLTLHSDDVRGLEKVNDSVFVTGSLDKRMLVWNENGDCIETHRSTRGITAMTRLKNGSIMTANSRLVEIRQLTSSSNLTHKCAKVIAKNIRKEVLEGLAMVIPEELFQMCVMYHDCKW